jgi:hypothetical protein
MLDKNPSGHLIRSGSSGGILICCGSTGGGRGRHRARKRTSWPASGPAPPPAHDRGPRAQGRRRGRTGRAPCGPERSTPGARRPPEALGGPPRCRARGPADFPLVVAERASVPARAGLGARRLAHDAGRVPRLGGRPGADRPPRGAREPPAHPARARGPRPHVLRGDPPHQPEERGAGLHRPARDGDQRPSHGDGELHPVRRRRACREDRALDAHLRGRGAIPLREVPREHQARPRRDPPGVQRRADAEDPCDQPEVRLPAAAGPRSGGPVPALLHRDGACRRGRGRRRTSSCASTRRWPPTSNSIGST